MAQDGFGSFSRNLNPFRIIERQIDAMFDDSFGAGAAGAMADSQPEPAGALIESPWQSLFMRVVQVQSTSRRRHRSWGG